MSTFLKIGIIALIYLFISVILKSYRPEYVFLMRVFAVVLVFATLVDDIARFISNILSIFTVFNIESEYINLLLKITGIAIITDFICDTLIDSGEKSLAGVVAISSKFLIMFLSLPILNGLILFCIKFVE